MVLFLHFFTAQIKDKMNFMHAQDGYLHIVQALRRLGADKRK
jgi:hypothetical protein